MAASSFNIFIVGQIESATFPLGPDSNEIFCRYEILSGPDWELVAGINNGISQTASNRNGNFNDEIVFNMPIEATFKSTNPHGWPQIIISLYGKTRWGVETTIGYSRIHVPISSLSDTNIDNSIIVPILIPKCTNMVSEMAHWISGRNPELKNPKILIDNTKCRGLSVDSYGELNLKLNIVSKGLHRLGYDWG